MGLLKGLGGLDPRIRVVVAANFVAVAARMSVVTFLGIYFVRVAHIGLATVGAAFLLESLLRGVAAPMFGALSDRIGRRSLLVGSAVCTAAILPCFLLVRSPASLFAWSAAMGIAAAASMPVSTALLLDLAPPARRQAVLAINYTGMSVAYTLGVTPAGYIAQQGYGWLATASGLGFALVAALYLLALRGALPAGGHERSASLASDVAAVARDRLFLAFAALGFIFPFSMGQVVTASPIFAKDLALDEGFIGLVLGGNSILVALLAVPVAARIEPMGPFRMLGAAAFLVSLCFLLYGLIPDAALAYLAGTVVFSFGEIVFSSAVPAAVARIAPSGRRGAYQGGWTLIASLSMGSALFVSGLARDAVGWSGAWFTYAALVLAAAAALFATRNRFLERVRE